MNTLSFRLNQFVEENIEEIECQFGFIPTFEKIDVEEKDIENLKMLCYFAGTADAMIRIKKLFN